MNVSNVIILFVLDAFKTGGTNYHQIKKSNVSLSVKMVIMCLFSNF